MHIMIQIPYKIFRKLLLALLSLILLVVTSCEDFVAIDSPNNQLIGAEVFEDAKTVDAAFAHIYSQLRENTFTDGTIVGLSYRLGHYTDELDLYSANLPEVQNYSNNTVLPSDSTVKTWWDTGYNLIYATNRILEGVQNSTALSHEDKSRFIGESYFLRGFLHFHLVNLFGPIPYIETTDYRTNSDVSRLNEDDVYQKIVEDVLNAKSLLPKTDITYANLRPNHWVAAALLSRIYLYTQNWQLALNEASHIIANGTYTLTNDLNQVFLNNSTETLWQLDAGIAGNNTKEASTFIFVSAPPPNAAISSFLLNAFENNDARFSNWVGSISDGSGTWYYPFKYKLNTPTGTTEECSILVRLAELYLIAAEAQVQLGNLSEALDYVNIIRSRASLEPIELLNQNDLLNSIIQERRIEFFSEQGHRFFDLKRTAQATQALAPLKPNWQDTDILFPIPESELLLNPNLLPQNEGY